MKVIGTIQRAEGGHGRYLVEADGDELARLMGFPAEFRHYDPRESENPNIYVGREIPVNKWWDQLHAVAAVRDQMERLVKQIRAQADALDAVCVPAVPTAKQVREAPQVAST